MLVVLDTNVLISGIFWKGLPYEILELWARKKLRVVATPVILQEYYALLQRFDVTGDTTQQWMTFIVENTEVVTSNNKIKICRDPFDDMFINCAVTGKADYIISGDKDLLSIREAFGVSIIKPKQLLSIVT